MRGYRFSGDLTNGDEVSIPARRLRSGEILRVKRFMNLTTGATVSCSYGRVSRLFGTLGRVLVATAMFGGLIALGIVLSHH